MTRVVNRRMQPPSDPVWDAELAHARAILAAHIGTLDRMSPEDITAATQCPVGGSVQIGADRIRPQT